MPQTIRYVWKNWKLCPEIVSAVKNNSDTLIMDRTDVSLMFTMNSLVTAGKLLRMACGRITLVIVCQWVKPSAWAASN